MKKCMKLLAVLMILTLLAPAPAHMEGDAPLCEDCGGTAQLTRCLDQGETHVMACPHDVIDESTRAVHTGTDLYGKDGVNHWLLCDACGCTMYTASHSISCKDSAHCEVCGADYSGGSVSHYGDNNWYGNAEDHWCFCTECGEQTRRPLTPPSAPTRASAPSAARRIPGATSSTT